MTSSATVMTLEQRVYDLLSPYRILTMVAGHVNENKDEDEAAYTILKQSIAHLARRRFQHTYSEFDALNVTVASAAGNDNPGNSKIAILIRKEREQIKILQAEIGEDGDWIGELVKEMDGQTTYPQRHYSCVL